MSYWSYLDIENNAPLISAYVYGEEFEWDMVFTNDTEDDILAAYLFTDTDLAGRVSVKGATWPDFLPVCGPFDPLCYLGHLPVGDTAFTFRYCNSTESRETLSNIPLYMATELGSGPYFCFDHAITESPWGDSYEQQSMWRDWHWQLETTSLPLSGDGGSWAETVPEQFSTSFPEQWRTFFGAP